MLIKCPECSLQVSDTAVSCPHCGYILNSKKYKSYVSRTTRRKRLPNGFGQISKLSNKNLKKPYRAMVTIGKNDNGRPICKLLKPVSYFATYNEAYEALLNNAKNPYSIEKDLTVKEVFDRWIERYEKQVSKGRLTTIKSAWKYAQHLYNVKFSDIRIRHILSIIENGENQHNSEVRTIPESSKANILTIFRGMYDYAIEYEIVSHNYANEINLAKRIDYSVKKGHKSFNKKEMMSLWNNTDNIFVRLILIHCYSGWRPSEILELKLENIHLDEGYMVDGMKTENGKNRIVPICPKIRNFIEAQYHLAKEVNSEYLFFKKFSVNKKIRKMSYACYAKEFSKVLTDLNLNEEHLLHDCRKTFVTMAKENKVDEYAIKYIVGHSIKDLTERVYTDRTIEWLISEMNKMV